MLKLASVRSEIRMRSICGGTSLMRQNYVRLSDIQPLAISLRQSVILSSQSDPPVRLLAAYTQFFPEETPTFIVQAPGRAMWAAARKKTGEHFHLASFEHNGRAQFSYQSAKNRRTLLNRPLPLWARYAAGVLVELADSGVELICSEAVIVGDEPTGQRYDVSLGMTFGALCFALSGQVPSEKRLFELAERVRHAYVEG
jgi:hypothetical protein